MHRSRALTTAAAAAVVLLVLLLAACGSSAPQTDKAKITALIKDYGNHPTNLCTKYATPAMLKAQFGSKAACIKAAETPGAKDAKLTVDSVKVTGKTAVAVRTSGTNPGKGTKATIRLVKRGGQWRIRQVAPRAS